ncbi:MAG TPA: hypothetical protein VH720_15565, partial [Candidatus Limnocylindrales bacterium]
MRSRRDRMAVASVALIVAACASPASPIAPGPASSGRSPSASAPARPSPSPIPGLTWRTASVERPAEAFPEIPSDSRTPSGPGTAGHPGHFPGQSIVENVTGGPDGLTAVGYVAIDGEWHALAWVSTDGSTWRLERIDDGAASFAVDVTATSAGRIAVVGRSGPDAAAWFRGDGGAWQAAPVTRLRGDERERMTAVLATPSGLIAGGSAGPELFERRARF